MADRREQLLGWIAETERLQRRMAVGFALALAICVALMVALDGPIGTLALVCVAGTAMIAFWVTYAHNASHRQKLAELDAAERRQHQPQQLQQRGGHRRWRST